MKLIEVDNIKLGGRGIKSFEDVGYLTDKVSIEFNDGVLSEYNGELVIIGVERGSKTVALEQFHRNADLALSILRLYSFALVKQSHRKVDIRLVDGMSNVNEPASTIGRCIQNNKDGYSRNFLSTRKFELNNELLKYLESELFLNEFSSLIDKNTRSELENSIIKSLYWIGEAHKDKSNSSAFVKLWSALECFFTLGEEKITESNSRGISSIIIFGGFIFDEYQEYNDLKKRVKFLYGLRSKIVHHAIHTHIDDVLLGEIALISSWVTIVMMSLVNKGYTDLKQVEFETKRLDNISKR